MGIDKLLSTVNRTLPLHKRYDATTLESYITDLKALLRAESEGKNLPSIAAVVEYMAREYDIQIGGEAVKRHLASLRKGDLPWPTE